MLKRLIYAAVGVVGVLVIGLAVASATVWRADSVLRASATADQAILVTDPGVLEMAGDPVTVTATVPAGGHVVMAVGRDTDVAGWVGADPSQRVSGLAGWHALALAAGPVPSGSPAPTPGASPSEGSDAAPSVAATTVPDATASDMWVAQAQGTGSATLTWQSRPGRWSLLVVGSSAAGTAAPPTVEMAWPRTVTTPYLVPGSVVGGLLVLVSLGFLWRELRHRHAAAWTPVLTEPVPVVAGAGAQRPLTRRQIRELETLARTGQIPTVAAAEAVAVTSGVPVVGGSVAVAAAPSAHDEGPGAAERGVAAGAAPATDEGPEQQASRHSAAAHHAVDGPSRDDSDVTATGELPSLGAASPVPGGRRARRHAAAADDAERTVAVPAPGRPVSRGSGDRDAEAAATDRVGVLAAGPVTSVAGTADATTPAAGETAADAPSTGRAPVAGATPPPPADSAPTPRTSGRPAWMQRRPTAPTPPTTSSDSATPGEPVSTARGPGATAQPAWLRRVAARWEQEDAAEDAAASPGSPVGSSSTDPEPADHADSSEPTDGPASQPEPSRADAWRRAWGLPPLDVEEDHR